MNWIDRKYWSLKNLVGYAVIRGDDVARSTYEKELEEYCESMKINNKSNEKNENH
jgi:hypothetical protein